MGAVSHQAKSLVNIENGRQVSESVSSNGCVVLLNIVRMNHCLCFACTQTSHIPVASRSLNLSISDRIATGCRCASRRSQSLIVIMEADVGSTVDDVSFFLFFRSAIVGSVGGAPACMVIGVVVPISEVRA